MTKRNGKRSGSWIELDMNNMHTYECVLINLVFFSTFRSSLTVYERVTSTELPTLPLDAT